MLMHRLQLPQYTSKIKRKEMILPENSTVNNRIDEDSRSHQQRPAPTVGPLTRKLLNLPRTKLFELEQDDLALIPN